MGFIFAGGAIGTGIEGWLSKKRKDTKQKVSRNTIGSPKKGDGTCIGADTTATSTRKARHNRRPIRFRGNGRGDSMCENE